MSQKSLYKGDLVARTLFVDAEYGFPASVAKPQRKDRPFLQIADALAAARDGDTIYVLPGVHETDHLTIDRRVCLIGQGAVLRPRSSRSDAGFIQVMADDVLVSGLTIDAAGASDDDTRGAIEILGAARTVLRDLHIYDARGTGILATTFGVDPLKGGRIERCRIERCGLEGGQTVFVSGIRFEGQPQGGGRWLEEWVIDACAIENCRLGITMLRTRRCSLLNTSIRNSRGYGVRLGAGSTAGVSESTLIQGCSILDSGLEIEDTDALELTHSERARVIGNVIGDSGAPTSRYAVHAIEDTLLVGNDLASGTAGVVLGSPIARGNLGLQDSVEA